MGKTLAFGLPTIERLYQLRRDEGWTSAPRALVMAPTRELAQQVAKELSVVAPKLSLLCVYGGSAMGPQCNALRNGVDLIRVRVRVRITANPTMGPQCNALRNGVDLPTNPNPNPKP